MTSTTQGDYIKLMLDTVAMMMVIVSCFVTTLNASLSRDMRECPRFGDFVNGLVSRECFRVFSIPFGDKIAHHLSSLSPCASVALVVYPALRAQLVSVFRVVSILALVITQAIFAPIMVSVSTAGTFREIGKRFRHHALGASFLPRSGNARPVHLPIVVSVDKSSRIALLQSLLAVCLSDKVCRFAATAFTEFWGIIGVHKKFTFLVSKPRTLAASLGSFYWRYTPSF